MCACLFTDFYGNEPRGKRRGTSHAGRFLPRGFPVGLEADIPHTLIFLKQVGTSPRPVVQVTTPQWGVEGEDSSYPFLVGLRGRARKPSLCQDVLYVSCIHILNSKHSNYHPARASFRSRRHRVQAFHGLYTLKCNIR